MAWPKHPDRSNMTMREMTQEKRQEQMALARERFMRSVSAGTIVVPSAAPIAGIGT